MSQKSCLANAKVGDDIYVIRKYPDYRDLRTEFKTTVVGHTGAGQLVIGCNIEGGLNGSNFSLREKNEVYSRNFKYFATHYESKFITTKIVKNNLEQHI